MKYHLLQNNQHIKNITLLQWKQIEIHVHIKVNNNYFVSLKQLEKIYTSA